VYDSNRLRVKKTVGTTSTLYIYAGVKPIAEYTNGVLSTEYIYAGNNLVATIAGGAPTYFHRDHLSVRVKTDAAGNISTTLEALPFGEVSYQTGIANKWAFTTYERDGTGLDYAVARYYSSRVARFTTADLLAGRIEQPESLNRFTYVRNDPINLADPLGLATCAQLGLPPDACNTTITVPGDPGGDPNFAGGGAGSHHAPLIDVNQHVGGGGHGAPGNQGQQQKPQLTPQQQQKCAAIQQARENALHQQRNKNLLRLGAAFTIAGAVCLATGGEGCLLIAFGGLDALGVDSWLNDNFGYDAINENYDAQAKAAGCPQ
jgi:RHS repeat-associated protein